MLRKRSPMTNEKFSRQLTRSWVAGYILAIEDIQSDIEKFSQDKSASPAILLKLLDQKLKKSLKEAQVSLKGLERE